MLQCVTFTQFGEWKSTILAPNLTETAVWTSYPLGEIDRRRPGINYTHIEFFIDD